MDGMDGLVSGRHGLCVSSVAVVLANALRRPQVARWFLLL